MSALPEKSPGSRAGPETLALATLAVFGMVTVMGMIGPVLTDLAREFNVSLGQAGLLSAAMSLPWALGAPFSGLLSDRVGRRPLIVLSLVAVGCLSAVSALANDFLLLLGIRFLAGLGGSCGPPCILAALGDIFPFERRARAMTWFNMGFSLAAVAGVPAISVLAGLLGWRAAFAASGLVLLLSAILIQLRFPAARPTVRDGGVLVPYRALRKVAGLGNLLLANLLERSIFNAVSLYLPAFLMLSYGLSAVEVAPALAVAAIGACSGNLIGGWLGDRASKVLMFIAAQAVAGAVALVLFALPLGLTLSALGGSLFGIANSASRPGFLAFGSELAPKHRGAMLGLLALFNHGGFVAGSALGGLAIGLGGYAGFAWTVLAGGALAAVVALPLLKSDSARLMPGGALRPLRNWQAPE